MFGKGNASRRMVYCYGIWQPAFEEMERTEKDIVFHEGIPSSDLWEGSDHTLLVLDDLSREVVSNPNMEKVFVQYCRVLTNKKTQMSIPPQHDFNPVASSLSSI